MRAEDAWAAHECRAGFSLGCSATCIVIIIVGVLFILLSVTAGTAHFLDSFGPMYMVVIAVSLIAVIMAADKIAGQHR